MTLHEVLAVCHPSLTRERAWCRKCGRTVKVDSSECVLHGWPSCCGETMTIDSPKERRNLRQRKEKRHD